MLVQYTYEFDNSNSGVILKMSSTYYAFLGWNQCSVGQSPPVTEYGSFLRFDTSNLPDYAEVVDVKFRIRRRSDPVGDPDDYEIRFAIGDFIGGSLDGNAGEWNGGTEVLTLTAKPADKTTVGFDSAACALVDKSGDTDVSIKDFSYQGGGSASWSTNFNKSTTECCKLYVYFSIPSAEAAGEGTASASASVTHAAEASATGVGDSEAAAGLLLATASATASGTGSGESVAGLIRTFAATVTGTGEAAGDGILVAGGRATATGVGDASALARLLHSTATATATGVGTATASGGIEVPPLALHSATIAVAHTDSATIRVGAVDSATLSVAAEDAEELGPRRH